MAAIRLRRNNYQSTTADAPRCPVIFGFWRTPEIPPAALDRPLTDYGNAATGSGWQHGCPSLIIESMAQAQPPAGWFVHVKTFDAEDTPVVTRHFYVAEPDRARAEEIAAELGETAEAIHPLSQRDLDELKLAPGEKKEHDYDR